MSRPGASAGAALKPDPANYRGKEINHSRLCQNLDRLVERDLVTKQGRDRRANEYRLTETARRGLEAGRMWQAGGKA